jgi:hypothetical protein
MELTMDPCGLTRQGRRDGDAQDRQPSSLSARPHPRARFDVMATVVLRVRLTGGERMDITYEDPHTSEENELVEHVVSTLAEDSGVLRSRHGDRLVILYGRGVAAIEVAPRGAVL